MLVGRDDETQLLADFVRDSRQQGAALLLHGDPGVGKSVLLEEAARRARRLGTAVLRAAGAEFEAQTEYSGLQQLLAPLEPELDRLAPPQQRALATALGLAAGGFPPPHVVARATLRLLVSAASARPVLLLVDDLHWIDPATMAVLVSVGSRVAGTRIGLLAAARDGYPHAPEASTLPSTTVLPLQPEAAQQLLAARFPVLAAQARDGILALAQGNPLALLELPAPGPDRSPGYDGLPVTLRLEGVFAGRLGSLPPGARRLLLLAVLDGTGSAEVLRRCLPDQDVVAQLAPAVRARLVQVETDGSVRFRHPLISSSVVGLSTATQRRDAHRALAAALPDTSIQHAWHLAEAATGPDERVAAMLESSAPLALGRGDAAHAVASLHRAAALSPARPDRARRLASAAHLAAHVTGQLAEVPGVVARSQGDGPSQDPPLLAAAAAAYALLNGEGTVDTAFGLIATALEDDVRASGALHREAQLEALHTLMVVCSFGGRDVLWARFHDAVAGVGIDVPRVLALGAAVFGDPVGRGREALPLLEVTIAELAEESDPTVVVRLGMAAFYVHRTGACRPALWRVVLDARDGGAVGAGINAMLQLALDDLMTGNWDASGRLAAESLALCESQGYALLAWPARYCLALLSAARGQREEATAAADAMLRWGTERGAAMMAAYAHHVLALLACGQQDFDSAYEHATAVAPAGSLHVAHALWVALDLVEAAVHTGRREDARAHVAALIAGDVGSLSPRYALLCEAAAALVEPDERSAERLERALLVDGASRWCFDHARVQLLCGEILRRNRRPARARPHLEAARASFQALGAAPWAVRADVELRAATGARGGAAPTHPRLTEQELQVAMLAASGLSNKQIGQRLLLSPRTVSAHLYRVFPKLEVTSRAALRDALERAQPGVGAG